MAVHPTSKTHRINSNVISGLSDSMHHSPDSSKGAAVQQSPKHWPRPATSVWHGSRILLRVSPVPCATQWYLRPGSV